MATKVKPILTPGQKIVNKYMDQIKKATHKTYGERVAFEHRVCKVARGELKKLSNLDETDIDHYYLTQLKCKTPSYFQSIADVWRIHRNDSKEVSDPSKVMRFFKKIGYFLLALLKTSGVAFYKIFTNDTIFPIQNKIARWPINFPLKLVIGLIIAPLFFASTYIAGTILILPALIGLAILGIQKLDEINKKHPTAFAWMLTLIILAVIAIAVASCLYAGIIPLTISLSAYLWILFLAITPSITLILCKMIETIHRHGKKSQKQESKNNAITPKEKKDHENKPTSRGSAHLPHRPENLNPPKPQNAPTSNTSPPSKHVTSVFDKDNTDEDDPFTVDDSDRNPVPAFTSPTSSQSSGYDSEDDEGTFIPLD